MVSPAALSLCPAGSSVPPSWHLGLILLLTTFIDTSLIPQIHRRHSHCIQDYISLYSRLKRHASYEILGNLTLLFSSEKQTYKYYLPPWLWKGISELIIKAHGKCAVMNASSEDCCVEVHEYSERNKPWPLPLIQICHRSCISHHIWSTSFCLPEFRTSITCCRGLILTLGGWLVPPGFTI